MNVKQTSMTLLLAIAVVSFWRGMWGIMDMYLLPNNMLASSLLSLMIGITIVYSVKHKLKMLI